MDTKVVKMSEDKIDQLEIERAGEIIRRGGLVAFPTETVYGLGANAMSAEAAAKVYKAKGRPSDNPLIAHIADLQMLNDLVNDVPEMAKILVDKFWPGPMTLIFNKSEKVPKGTTGGLNTVAVRYPKNKIACELINSAGMSIAAPSANLSGRPSPTMGEHVIDDMDGRIEMIIDGGVVDIGLESTIIDVTVTPPLILRPGFITYEMIKEVIGRVEIDKAVFEKPKEGFTPRAPGMKYRHYAPKAEYIIYRGQREQVAHRISMLAKEASKSGKKIGIITAIQNLDLYKNIGREIDIVPLGDLNRPETIASQLFKVLRDFDKKGVEVIFGEAFSEDNVGLAIMNRLTKAAGYNVIDV